MSSQSSAKHWAGRWALNEGSLTEAIQAVCRLQFQLRRLSDFILDAPESVSEVLNLTHQEPVRLREVLLCDGETPLVYACSLLPVAACSGRYADLEKLGNRPLGQWIFAKPSLVREQLHFGLFAPDSALLADLSCAESVLGRKTLFVGAAKPLLVSEFFLPALSAY